nr:hypothetical protein [Tanacetum cinerariifolium]
ISETSSQSPSNINHCCCECGDPLDDIFCKRCTYPEEEPEEEDGDMVNNEEVDAEVINPYEEDDPHNRPPPTSDEETEFAPPVVQITDVDDVPIPPVIQFGSNFHIGESSATRDLLAAIAKFMHLAQRAAI